MLNAIPKHCVRSAGCFWFVLALSFFALLSVPVVAGSLVERSAVSNPNEIWSAWGGQAQFKFAPMVLRDMQLDIRTPDQVIKGALSYTAEPVQSRIANLGSLTFHAPFGHFEGFVDGRLTINQPMTMRLQGGREVSWQTMVISARDTEDFPGLQLHDGNGNLLFTTANIHVYVDQIANQLTMERMDVSIAAELARRLGQPAFAGQYIGEMVLGSQLNIPGGALTEVRGGTCADRPKWPTEGFVADVGLTNMNSIQDVGSLSTAQGDFELVAPSSSLINLQGLDGADVTWFEKFTGTFPPYNTDQHPYLIWNMYRVDSSGRMEQIGRSGIKHAFFTVNQNCTVNCGDGGIPGAGGHILWPGCRDTYPVGNNDNPGDIGPRDEVNPLTGVFVSTGSFFDQIPPGGNGVQDNSSTAPGENRMQVLTDDLQIADADYFFESWYVIRDDSNIFNSMGFNQITPVNNPGGSDSWSYSQGAFNVGAVIDQWVAPATDPASGSQNVAFFSPSVGHFKLAVRTTDLGGGLFQYDYMLMNFDVNAGIAALTFDGVSGVEPDSINFHDVDQDTGNDWSVSTGPLRFAAAPGEQMPWGNGYTFSFVAGPPVLGTVTVSIGDSGGIPSNRRIEILTATLPEVLLVDGFESPAP